MKQRFFANWRTTLAGIIIAAPQLIHAGITRDWVTFGTGLATAILGGTSND